MRTVAERLGGKAAVVQINTQDHPALGRRFGVTGVPVSLLLHQGRILGNLPGAQSPETVLTWFREKTT